MKKTQLISVTILDDCPGTGIYDHSAFMAIGGPGVYYVEDQSTLVMVDRTGAGSSWTIAREHLTPSFVDTPPPITERGARNTDHIPQAGEKIKDTQDFALKMVAMLTAQTKDMTEAILDKEIRPNDDTIAEMFAPDKLT